MRSNRRTLPVTIGNIEAGILEQSDDGALSFQYAQGYRGVPLSLSMPLSNRKYGDKTVRPFLFGLLPDNAEQRRAIGRQHGISGENPFALLEVIGLDCPGAIQVGRGLSDDGIQGSYSPLSPDDIAQRLRNIKRSAGSSWQAPREHWSLGGAQAKMALACFDGNWYSCEGTAPTTHILKPGVSELAHQALNEHLCLATAARCGIPAADSSYVEFEGEGAVVSTRFDRVVRGRFEVLRLHQEDFCQALGVFPDRKYANEGGPGARDVLHVLAAQPNSEANRVLFAGQLFFNYLIGAPDAHAKNYSILLTEEEGVRLSPLYDVASALPYESPAGSWKMAMSIGGENRFGQVKKSHLVRFAEAAGLEASTAMSLMANLALRIPDALSEVVRECEAPGAQELGARLVPAVADLCARTLTLLE